MGMFSVMQTHCANDLVEGSRAGRRNTDGHFLTGCEQPFTRVMHVTFYQHALLHFQIHSVKHTTHWKVYFVSELKKINVSKQYKNRYIRTIFYIYIYIYIYIYKCILYKYFHVLFFSKV